MNVKITKGSGDIFADLGVERPTEGALSPAAMTVAGSVFGFMTPDSHMRFGMKESRPSDEMQAALDELVAAKLLSREDEPSGAVIYRPIGDCAQYKLFALSKKAPRIRISVPI